MNCSRILSIKRPSTKLSLAVKLFVEIDEITCVAIELKKKQRMLPLRHILCDILTLISMKLPTNFFLFRKCRGI